MVRVTLQTGNTDSGLCKDEKLLSFSPRWNAAQYMIFFSLHKVNRTGDTLCKACSFCQNKKERKNERKKKVAYLLVLLILLFHIDKNVDSHYTLRMTDLDANFWQGFWLFLLLNVEIWWDKLKCKSDFRYKSILKSTVIHVPNCICELDWYKSSLSSLTFLVIPAFSAVEPGICFLKACKLSIAPFVWHLAEYPLKLIIV